MTRADVQFFRNLACSGEWVAFWNTDELWEYGHDPLEADKQIMGRQLLADGLSDVAFDALVNSIGGDTAVRILQRALVPQGGPFWTRTSADMFCEQRGEHWSWLLERVGVGYTGVIVDMVLTGMVNESSERQGMTTENAGEQWWRWRNQTLEVTDDAGGNYVCRGISWAGFGRTRFMERDGVKQFFCGQRYNAKFIPGPSIDATELVFVPGGEISLEEVRDLNAVSMVVPLAPIAYHLLVER